MMCLCVCVGVSICLHINEVFVHINEAFVHILIKTVYIFMRHLPAEDNSLFSGILIASYSLSTFMTSNII